MLGPPPAMCLLVCVPACHAVGNLIRTNSLKHGDNRLVISCKIKRREKGKYPKQGSFEMQALPNTGPMPPGYGEPTTALPLLAFDNGENTEFDYSTFLQDQQDIDYLAEDSSGSGGLPIATPSPSSTFSDQPFQPQPLAPRQQQQLSPASARQRGCGTGRDSSGSHEDRPVSKQRLERRGHTKSRRGCFNCKRRRIKCQETKPACGHCVKQGLKCEYPTLPTIVHQYEYLMHAILGYSASELMASSDPSLAEAAMSHRYKAVKAIKKALTPPPTSPAAPVAGSSSNNLPTNLPTPPNNSNSSNNGRSFDDTMFEEGNALMATCFALTYQSVLLEDGMAEFMTFIRGIMIVAIHMYCRGANLLFGHLLGDRQTQMLEPHMRDLDLIDAGLTARAVAAVEGLRGLVDGVEGREVERRYWEMIGEMARNLGVSSWKEHYGWWMMLPHAKFQPLVDPNNQVALVLNAHWVALEQIMAPICEAEQRVSAAMSSGRSSSKTGASLGNIRWLRYINAQVDADHRPYNEWPMWVEAQLAKDMTCFGKTM
ncbi:hypothetical protein CHGG_10362 [Chaetomium globosum CBS 148.51]|uniref:Zn(2)-C6 fungal-type domain-containing protein n=1 Tax=Chaetomium globosum (strain ATCC 6205 / CBS 148.51 / DSM 1962 / NBRC 6347 / NRRL 1970) TaxID=306901 RepID=Q2GNU2_CHAGB|nr:uncharacterized protein CHGG_10362 [Chaetomium globosum CBS 148.51]EAQ83958.1 hypothetical protein CHGG_10362 [Chaetomium globosum CBS 148.51]